jgi:hypothetical protein
VFNHNSIATIALFTYVENHIRLFAPLLQPKPKAVHRNTILLRSGGSVAVAIKTCQPVRGHVMLRSGRRPKALEDAKPTASVRMRDAGRCDQLK